MKFNILKVIVVCTMVLSLLFVGVASIDTGSDVVAYHDGWSNEDYVY